MSARAGPTWARSTWPHPRRPGRARQCERSSGRMTSSWLTVEVPRSEFDQLGVVEGDSVQADVRTANVFVGDFSI